MRTLFALLLLSAGTALADDKPAVWTQWRGPNRDGVATGPAWPNKLEKLTKVWSVENLGPSYSGPLVSADRVFTTETVEKKTEVVTAYDRKTGKELWKAKWDGALTVPFFAAKNGSWIRATPALDGNTLFVPGIRDLLVALDATTGKELWKLDCMKEFGAPAPDFGFVSSPLVDETGVYVQAGGRFLKADKKTGKVLWSSLKDGGGMMGSAFASPVFAKLAGTEQVLVQTRTKLAGVDRATGKELWAKDVPSFRGMNILTPVPVGDDGVFTSTYGGNTQLLKIKSDGGNYSAAGAWNFKYEGNMSSPVVVKNHAYWLGKDKRLICANLETGKEAWRTEERFGEYMSLVANGDKILALDQRGTLFLFRATEKEYDPLDKKKVADDAWAHLAVCGNEIVVRDLYGLTVWKWEQ